MILPYKILRKNQNVSAERQCQWMMKFLIIIQLVCNRLQNSIKLLIERFGFEVIIVFNGQEAITKIQQLQKCSKECELLNLILMDYSMPILNGIECTIQLKRMMREKIIPTINIIGLTAFTSKLEVESCLNAGMMEVLFKPLKLNDFCELLTLL